MHRLLLLLLAGCAGSSADLLEQAKQCGSGPECNEQWEKWNSAVERKKSEEKQQCPGDMVRYSDRHGDDKCITRQALKDFLDSLRRGY